MFLRSNALLISLAAVAVTSVVAAGTRAGVIENFDSYAGTAATDVHNYSAAWTQVASQANQTAGAVGQVYPTTGTTPAADKAFDGSSYLRLADPNATVLAAVRYNFSGSAVSAAGDGVNISFALRDDVTLNSNQVYIFNSAGAARANTLLQLGINSGGKFSYTSYSLISGTSTGTTTTLNAVPSAVAGTWYVFNIAYKLDNNSVGTYALTISDPSKPAGQQTVYSATNLSGVASGLTGGGSVGNIIVQTSGGGTGNADFDAFSVAPVPEPAAGAAIGLGGMALLALRRRRLAK